MRGQRFESLEETQRYLDHWSDRWADTRIHGTTKQQVAVMFAEKKPSLQTLPVESFRYYQHGTRAVHVDGTVEVARAYYAAPPAWIGGTVHVRRDQRFVRILDPKTGPLLREHLRTLPGLRRVDPRERSPKTPKSIQQRCARVEGKTSAIAFQKPRAPSPIASSGACSSPRFFRSIKISRQLCALSR